MKCILQVHENRPLSYEKKVAVVKNNKFFQHFFYNLKTPH